MKPLYCITAINKLTRERERVSCISYSKDTLHAIKARFLATRSSKRTHIYPRIVNVQEKLF